MGTSHTQIQIVWRGFFALRFSFLKIYACDSAARCLLLQKKNSSFCFVALIRESLYQCHAHSLLTEWMPFEIRLLIDRFSLFYLRHEHLSSQYAHGMNKNMLEKEKFSYDSNSYVTNGLHYARTLSHSKQHLSRHLTQFHWRIYCRHKERFEEEKSGHYIPSARALAHTFSKRMNYGHKA